MREEIASTAQALVAGDKGLLAIDESNGTCDKRFARWGIPQTQENRRAYRELIVTTPGLGESISGVILYDETIRQRNGDGTPFVRVIVDAGMIPGIKVVAPSSPVDVVGLMAAAVRDQNPVIFHEHKALYAMKGEVPDGEIVDTLGTAKILRAGGDCTIVALALMVSRALQAADTLKREHGIDAEVIDVRSLVPLDTQTILGSVAKTGRLFTVEENPRLCGWGAEIASIVADEAFWDLDGPIVRITTPHIPLPAADHLEDLALPSAARIVDKIRRVMNG